MQRPSLDQQVTFFYTHDLSRTGDFYERVMGLPLVLDQRVCRIYRVCDDAFIGFCEHLQRPTAIAGVILTLATREVDAWAAYLTAQGVPLEKPPVFNPEYNIYHLFLRDPNGYLLEIQTFLDPAWPA
jgi:catechol 2,3-dioxygenase-like lactoylglutathione lyase family enzyme